MLQESVMLNARGFEEDQLTHEVHRKMLTNELIYVSHWIEVVRVKHNGLGRASEVLRLVQDEGCLNPSDRVCCMWQTSVPRRSRTCQRAEQTPEFRFL